MKEEKMVKRIAITVVGFILTTALCTFLIALYQCSVFNADYIFFQSNDWDELKFCLGMAAMVPAFFWFAIFTGWDYWDYVKNPNDDRK